MESYLRWYVELETFYKILIIASLLIGSLALLTGVGTQNPVFILVGAFWLVGGPLVIWVMTALENR